jgi:hypothetical protein
LDATLTTLLCKKISCEIQRSENRMRLAESSTEGYGSKKGCYSNGGGGGGGGGEDDGDELFNSKLRHCEIHQK